MKTLLSLAVELAKALWDPFKRHAGYLLCAGRHVQKLQARLEALEQRRTEVQLDVDAALRSGRVVREDTSRWLASVDAVASEAKYLADQLTLTKCSAAGTCTAPCQRYGISREAAAKLAAVDELQHGGTFPEGVSRVPPPPRVESLLPNVGFEAFTCTKLAMQRVLDALQDARVRIVGVYGMGGVGKTTLMEEVAKAAVREELFDEVVMVTVSQNPDTKKIQQLMGEELGLKFDEESETVRAARLAARLKQARRPLLILDDLWERLEMVNIGIPCGETRHPDCKVVLTTRSRDVCRAMEVHAKIEVESLREEDAWTLFRERAGEVVESPAVHPLARDVSRECQGLPLALVTLGRAMRDKDDPRDWTTALEQLRRSTPANIFGMEKQVFQPIRVSFDSLESHEAKIFFLFCSLFPEDHEIDVRYLTRYIVGEGLLSYIETLEAAERHVHFVLENLKASSLLLEGNQAGSVKMHDVVRDVAIWIAAEGVVHGCCHSKPGFKFTDPGLERYQRISVNYTEVFQLPNKPICPNLRTLLLNNRRGFPSLPIEFFQAMEGLTVLDFSRNGYFSLSPSLPYLVNLRTLCLDRCPFLRDLSGIEKLEKLEILSLQRSYISKLPRNIVKLTNLRCLDLTNSRCTIRPGVISKLSMLEQLYAAEGFDQWQAKDSTNTRYAAFSELGCLSRLTDLFIDVRDRRCFSQDLGHGALEKLSRFRICNGRNRRGRMTPPTPNQLVVVRRVADWAVPLLKKVEELTIIEYAVSETLHSDDGKILPGSFSNIKRLELVKVPDLSKTNILWLSDQIFKNLRELTVASCEKLAFLPCATISTAHQLEKLWVSSCPQLKQVFKCNYKETSAGKRACNLLPKLQTLYLCDLPCMESIWVGDLPQGSLQCLKMLLVVKCNSLKHLFPPEMALLAELEELAIIECEQMERIFSSTMAGQLIFLPKLSSLHVLGCSKLASLSSWREIHNFERLSKLRISNCFRLKAVIMGDEETVADKKSVLPKLTELELSDLPQLTSFNTENFVSFDWPCLKTVSVKHCSQLKKLPLGLQSAPMLRRINGSQEWFDSLEWEEEGVRSRASTPH